MYRVARSFTLSCKTLDRDWTHFEITLAPPEDNEPYTRDDRPGGEFGDVDIAVPRVANAGIGADAAVIGGAAAQRRQHRLEVPVIGARHRLLVVHRRRPDNSLLTLKTTIMMEAIPQEFSASCVQTICVSPNRVNRA